MLNTSTSRRWFRWLAILMTTLVAIGGMAEWQRETLLEALTYEQPVQLDEAFHSAVQDADRIVIRRGGFDCCDPVDDDPVIFTVTGRIEVQRIASQIHVIPIVITNSGAFGSCGCCGYPGIDWYRGRKRVALTSVQHGKNLRWNGFSTTRVLGYTVGYVDAPLLTNSSTWLTNWLSAHGALDTQLDATRGQTTNYVVPQR